jgi:uncharacterized protein with HEPN domain
MSGKSDLPYLKQILRSIEKIGRYTEDVDHKEFTKNEMLQSAVLRELMVITGIVKEKLSKSVKEKYPEIPWSGIAGMRDKLAHSYLDVNVNLSIVWDVVKDELPRLRDVVKRAIEDMESKSPSSKNV